jgi:hypothetical protein
MARVSSPDRWIEHHGGKCGQNEGPEGYGYCTCPPGWPRRAAYWRGEAAVGAKRVEALIAKWKAAITTAP